VRLSCTILLGAYRGIAKAFNNLKAGIYEHSVAVAEIVPALPVWELSDDDEFGSSFVLRSAIPAGRDLFAIAKAIKGGLWREQMRACEVQRGKSGPGVVVERIQVQTVGWVRFDSECV
jgi:hypothetical protein